MADLIDRQAANLNKKIFEVTEVTKDEAGEIVALEGTLIRADNPTEVGTALNAKSLSLAMMKYYIAKKEVKFTRNTSTQNLEIEVADEEGIGPVEFSIEMSTNIMSYFRASISGNSNKKILTIAKSKDPEGVGTQEFTIIIKPKLKKVEYNLMPFSVKIIYTSDSVFPND